MGQRFYRFPTTRYTTKFYIMKRKLHGRLEIRNFVSPRDHVISSMCLLTKIEWFTIHTRQPDEPKFSEMGRKPLDGNSIHNMFHPVEFDSDVLGTN